MRCCDSFLRSSPVLAAPTAAPTAFRGLRETDSVRRRIASNAAALSLTSPIGKSNPRSQLRYMPAGTAPAPGTDGAFSFARGLRAEPRRSVPAAGCLLSRFSPDGHPLFTTGPSFGPTLATPPREEVAVPSLAWPPVRQPNRSPPKRSFSVRPIRAVTVSLLAVLALVAVPASASAARALLIDGS